MKRYKARVVIKKGKSVLPSLCRVLILLERGGAALVARTAPSLRGATAML